MFSRRSLLFAALLATCSLSAQETVPAPVRARDLGIPFVGVPGLLNAITDVRGVEVGFTTLIQGDGPLVIGKGPIRTGVTVIFPRGRTAQDSVMANVAVLNGNGEMTGTAWVQEGGFLDGPIAITNTHSVGVVRDAIIAWQGRTGNIPSANRFGKNLYFSLPVVAETADIMLNDINGFHVKPEHVFAALDNAKSGQVAEGNVGGGTGMICHGWKGGTGTASRKLSEAQGGYTVGVLVQANHGRAQNLTIAGVPIGDELMPPPRRPVSPPPGTGSIIVIVATDAPLLPHQLQRLAKRTIIGIGRIGGMGENSSGDLMLAFSTANPGAVSQKIASVQMVSNEVINPIFYAVEQATEEAIVNALIAAKTMTGADGLTVQSLPHDKLIEVLKKYNRVKPDAKKK